MALTTDELYLARMEAESAEQEAWERLRSDPDDAQLQAELDDAQHRAEHAGAAYLDALIREQGEFQERPLVAI